MSGEADRAPSGRSPRLGALVRWVGGGCRRPRRTLVAIGALAVLLRVAVVLVNSQVPLTRDITRDPGNFVDLATRILEGEGMYRDGVLVTYWPPAYLYFVAVWVRVEEVVGVGSLRFWIGLGQAVLAGITVVAVGALAHRRVGRRAGVVAALVLALWPNQLLMASVVMTEGLFTPLYTLGIVVLLWDERPRAGHLAASGALLGAAMLVRPAGLAVLGAAMAYAAWSHRRRLAVACGSAALVGSVFVLVLAPWLLYTRSVVGTPVLSSFMGYNLCLGHSDGATGEYEPDLCRLRPGEDPVAGDRRMRGEAIEWALAHPDREVVLLLRRAREIVVADFYAAEDLPDEEYDAPIPGPVVLVVTSAWWVAAVYLAARGWWDRRGDRFVRAGTLLWGASLVGALLTIGHIRFHDPIVPFMAILVAVRLTRERVGAGRDQASGSALASRSSTA